MRPAKIAGLTKLPAGTVAHCLRHLLKNGQVRQDKRHLPYDLTEIGREYLRRERQSLQQPASTACRCDEQPEKDLPRDDLDPCSQQYRSIILAAKAGKFPKGDALIRMSNGRITDDLAAYVACIVELIERRLASPYQEPIPVIKDEMLRSLLADLEVIEQWFLNVVFGKEPL